MPRVRALTVPGLEHVNQDNEINKNKPPPAPLSSPQCRPAWARLRGGRGQTGGTHGHACAMYACMVYMHGVCTHVCVRVCVCVCVCAMCVYMHVCMHVCMYACMHVRVCRPRKAASRHGGGPGEPCTAWNGSRPGGPFPSAFSVLAFFSPAFLAAKPAAVVARRRAAAWLAMCLCLCLHGRPPARSRQLPHLFRRPGVCKVACPPSPLFILVLARTGRHGPIRLSSFQVFIVPCAAGRLEEASHRDTRWTGPPVRKEHGAARRPRAAAGAGTRAPRTASPPLGVGAGAALRCDDARLLASKPPADGASDAPTVASWGWRCTRPPWAPSRTGTCPRGLYLPRALWIHCRARLERAPRLGRLQYFISTAGASAASARLVPLPRKWPRICELLPSHYNFCGEAVVSRRHTLCSKFHFLI